MKPVQLRLEIVALLSLPPLAATVLLLLYWNNLPVTERIFRGVSALLLAFGVVSECSVLYKEKTQGHRDQGIMSSLIASLLMLVMIAARSFSWPSLFEGSVRTVVFGSGIIVYSAGIVLRSLARKKLGRHFSYTVRIIEEHKLITTGIYTRIRHPAYLGTILVLTGIALLYGFGGYILPALFCLPLFRRRIIREEQLLSARFKDRFTDWKQRTGAVFPRWK